MECTTKVSFDESVVRAIDFAIEAIGEVAEIEEDAYNGGVDDAMPRANELRFAQDWLASINNRFRELVSARRGRYVVVVAEKLYDAIEDGDLFAAEEHARHLADFLSENNTA
jgi:hypothetical protein